MGSRYIGCTIGFKDIIDQKLSNINFTIEQLQKRSRSKFILHLIL